ncbi:hypothetical protein [Streptomyces roseochromogenus]|uniref:hypothetical protein n=1 Tax=Streptomyces roseochromogenus TaxID=285450 RepID=UPI000AD0EB01|nr:hypothetical protein [Streptomyces roseochromogenus]
MHRARVKRTGQPVYAYEIDRQPSWRGEDLVCWERDCGSAVREIGGYTKRDGTPYAAYFRLKNNIEHRAGCPLNPVEVITSIAQGSEGLATADKGVLRLTLPQDLSQPGTERPGPDGAPLDGEAIDRRITTVPPPLPALINSAVKIVRFLIAHDFDSKMVNRFRVLPYGRKRPVLWEEFCYGPTYTSYAGLYTLIRTGRQPGYPVALYGTVQHVRRDRNDRPYAVIATADPTGVLRFEVVLRSWYPSLIAPLSEGTHVLAVGDWDVWADGRVPQLRLFADDHWQIAYWTSDEATGDVSEPSCPPALTPRQRAAARPAQTSTARTGRVTKAVGRRSAASSARRTPATPASPSASSTATSRTRAPQPAVRKDPRPTTAAPDTSAARPLTPPGRGSAGLPIPLPSPPTPTGSLTEGVASPGSPSTPTSAEPQSPPGPPLPARPAVPDNQPAPPQLLPPVPPLPPLPPPDPGEGGRRWALGRWLKRVRRP